ncbi:hypothetical protein AMTRI_Chr04g188070 [Amborella trichopoda]
MQNSLSLSLCLSLSPQPMIHPSTLYNYNIFLNSCVSFYSISLYGCISSMFKCLLVSVCLIDELTPTHPYSIQSIGRICLCQWRRGFDVSSFSQWPKLRI